jgi:DNA-binding transcriptional MerR regulator
MTATASLRIGELSRRTGVAVELLRAWERRYGLLDPSRSSGGFRLYSEEDERRVRLMRDHIAGGLAAAEAARMVRSNVPPGAPALPASALAAGRGRLEAALDALDETGAHAALDALLAGFTRETVLSEVVVPYLAELGERWHRGDATVAQEHFASNLIRGRLLALAREWDRGPGLRALLACAPGELHDLPLIMLGLALSARGWRISFLGQDTPFETLADAGSALRPDAVVISSTLPERLAGLDRLRGLGRTTKLYLAGPGADAAAAEAIGAEYLAGDPVGAAELVR